MTSVTLAAAVLFLLPTPQPPQPPASPQHCVKAGRDHSAKRQREAGRLTGDLVRAIEAERAAIVKSCAAAFDVEKADPAQLPALIELFTEAQQPQLAERAIQRAADSKALTPVERAQTLGHAVRFLMRQSKSAERNARAERYVDLLDTLPGDVLDLRVMAHQEMKNYYRADDIDAGIVKHSTWFIDLAPTLTPEQRKRFGSMVITAYTNMAEVLAGQGENDQAIEYLRRAPKDLPDLPRVDAIVTPTLNRYLLVGTPAAAIKAPVWLNRDSTEPLDMTGSVTLLEFTAHWCGPCKESYPGLKRLRQRFGSRGFRVVLATALYGYFGAERDLTPQQEIEKDRAYFADLKLDGPIAIAARSMPGTVDGQAPAGDPYDAAYRVGGIPQINLIDRQGRIRLIMIGYDDENEEKLAAIIERLLSEK